MSTTCSVPDNTTPLLVKQRIRQLFIRKYRFQLFIILILFILLAYFSCIESISKTNLPSTNSYAKKSNSSKKSSKSASSSSSDESVYRFDIEVDIFVPIGAVFDEFMVKQHVQASLNNLQLNDVVLVEIKAKNTTQLNYVYADEDLIEIIVDIYTFDETDMLKIRIYMKSTSFAHDIQSVIQSPNKASGMEIDVSVTDTETNKSDSKWLSEYIYWVVPLVVVVVAICCMVTYCMCFDLLCFRKRYHNRILSKNIQSFDDAGSDNMQPTKGNDNFIMDDDMNVYDASEESFDENTDEKTSVAAETIMNDFCNQIRELRTAQNTIMRELENTISSHDENSSDIDVKESRHKMSESQLLFRNISRMIKHESESKVDISQVMEDTIQEMENKNDNEVEVEVEVEVNNEGK